MCSPANGILSVLFPTGHAFGIQMNNGIELLVHIGINTVEANGDGFKVMNVKQGDVVKAGQPIVEVDFKKLSKKYNINTMLIITNNLDTPAQFTEPKSVKRGDSVLK
ncbi:PTS sugar transporter subunit IIA [Holdemanella biformis]|uniref:PTS sugar transporter subunit IIA n=1 Tax=Holdemanella biformis TaxID=1735 RepID=UPI0022E0D895|nr:PTS glucose transporter subunit IIA [Holdemanella biformis]